MTDVGVQTTLVCPHSPYLRLKSFRHRSDSGLYDISYAVASDIVGLALDGHFTADPNDKHVDTMRKILAQFLKEQHGVLEKIIDDLNKVDVRENDLEPMFVAVADQVFTDGQCNWGRIVALHAFVYKLVESVRETPVAHSYGDKLSELLADYMSGRLAHWIRSVGGWDNFSETFAKAEANRKPHWSRMWTTLTIGLGLGLTGLLVVARVK